jgi:hypothetical protein
VLSFELLLPLVFGVALAVALASRRESTRAWFQPDGSRASYAARAVLAIGLLVLAAGLVLGRRASAERVVITGIVLMCLGALLTGATARLPGESVRPHSPEGQRRPPGDDSPAG